MKRNTENPDSSPESPNPPQKSRAQPAARRDNRNAKRRAERAARRGARESSRRSAANDCHLRQTDPILGIEKAVHRIMALDLQLDFLEASLDRINQVNPADLHSFDAALPPMWSLKKRSEGLLGRLRGIPRRCDRWLRKQITAPDSALTAPLRVKRMRVTTE